MQSANEPYPSNPIDHYSILTQIISRFDNYYDSVNNKSNLFLLVNTFFLGGFITLYINGKEKVHFSALAYIWTAFSVLAIGASLFFTIKAIAPYIKTGRRSVFFFGSVATSTLEDFKKDFFNISEKNLVEDLCEQAFFLAVGIDKKFKNLRFASLFLGTAIVFILLLTLTLTLTV